MTVNNKWQCVKCKITKIEEVNIVIDPDTNKEIIDPLDIPKITHCHHIMRNLNDDQYNSEKSINDSGARDGNKYRENPDYVPE
jgi:hypothetical protein